MSTATPTVLEPCSSLGASKSVSVESKLTSALPAPKTDQVPPPNAVCTADSVA